MSDECGVYIIKSLDSGRVYVGSSQRVRSRIAQHIKLLDNRKHHNDDMIHEWEKFGSDRFQFALLESCEKDKLRLNEFLWCKHYDSFNPEKGFNKNRSAKPEDFEPPHLLMNPHLWPMFSGWSHGLLLLALKMDRNNIVIISAKDRKVLASALGIAVQTFNNRMASIVKNGTISRVNNGEYVIDNSVVKWGKYQKLSARDIYAMLRYEEYQEKVA